MRTEFGLPALPGADRLDVRRAREAPGVLREFNDAGVLAAADVHVARRLARLGGDDDDRVLLAAALAGGWVLALLRPQAAHSLTAAGPTDAPQI